MSAPSDGARADARKRLAAAEVVPVDERIVAVLCEHDWFTPRGYAWPCCMCGEEFPDGDDAAFAHVATALAGVIADAKAEALREAARTLPGFANGINTHGDAARWLRLCADRIDREVSR